MITGKKKSQLTKYSNHSPLYLQQVMKKKFKLIPNTLLLLKKEVSSVSKYNLQTKTGL